MNVSDPASAAPDPMNPKSTATAVVRKEISQSQTGLAPPGGDIALEQMLNRIVDRPALHARWLNTLAFLEFMGTRKIARSLNGRRAGRVALQHLAEEARHAYFFKRSIERIAPEADPGFALSELLAGFSAARYFHGLDSLVHRDLLDENPAVAPELCYLYVTTLIEERAGWLYPAYDAVLEARRLPVRLTGVILEEEQHLADMYSAARRLDARCEERLAAYRVQEARGFAGFFTRLQAVVQSET
ncbi:MAG: hypothetical protein RIF32_00315 [Leptospirales bacterium]|jgi:hypothetical protein